ncbi:MAG TPA: hypothetical protein PLN69_02630 [bacterium]|nr:hypothetical protein [bacterium]
MGKIVGCRVFSANIQENTRQDLLGNDITEWMEKNPFAMMEDKYVAQSDTYISVLIFFSGRIGKSSPLDSI